MQPAPTNQAPNASSQNRQVSLVWVDKKQLLVPESGGVFFFSISYRENILMPVILRIFDELCCNLTKLLGIWRGKTNLEQILFN